LKAKTREPSAHKPIEGPGRETSLEILNVALRNAENLQACVDDDVMVGGLLL